jgi:RHS repeat-associated protein
LFGDNATSDSTTVSGLAPVSGTFNPDDELSAETYDQSGNVTASGDKSFTYDAENHLISMGGTVSLVYDGDGNRVAKTVSGVTTKYLVDDLNPTDYPQVMDELTNAAVTRSYTYGLQRISQNQLISNTWTPSFYGYDGFGSVRQLTNTAGTITDTYDYDAFGNKINSTGTTPNSYMYRGEAFDSDLGLYYLRARWMNPLTGRFMSRDPEDGKLTDPGSLHKYLYAFGDPVNRIDPRGRASILETGSLDELIGTTPVPALVELGGGAYASAASWATDQYFLYAASTSNIVEAVSDFIEGVDWIELTSGLTKAFLCIKAEDFLFDQLERRVLDFEGDHPDTWLEQKAKDKFEETCWVLAGKAL